MARSFCIRAFAKLNLYLKVLEKRPDNYHNLITLFERINFFDRIWIRERSDNLINIRSNSKDLRFLPSSLIYQTTESLRKDLKINKGVDIYIEKSIPIASGLGGGSSDSAALLLGLNKLWKLKLTLPQLICYAKKLGADVAFFLYDCSFAIGKERGDLIEPLRIKDRFWHTLILPPIKVLSKDIYLHLDCLKQRSCELTKQKPDVKMLIKGLLEKNISLIEKNIYNQLEKVTLSLYPILNKLKTDLEKKGFKNIFMSGSGPAMFGIFSSRKEAQWFKTHLEESKRFRVVLTHTV